MLLLVYLGKCKQVMVIECDCLKSSVWTVILISHKSYSYINDTVCECQFVTQSQTIIESIIVTINVNSRRLRVWVTVTV